MLRTMVALFAGTLFGVGLAVSGMMNPQKVIGFLDVAGASWDPTLIFVMGGALLVTIPAFRVILKRPSPILADGFALPKQGALDARLLGRRAVRRRLGALRVLPRAGGGGPGHGACAGAGLRGLDADGDGPPRANLPAARSWRPRGRRRLQSSGSPVGPYPDDPRYRRLSYRGPDPLRGPDGP